ncbi:MAG: HD domain-containing phosphohydrolase [bacterium]
MLPCKSQEYLVTLLDTMSDCIFTVKMPEKTIEYINKAGLQMFGYQPEEVIGQSMRIFYPDEPSYISMGLALQSKIAKNETQVCFEQELVGKNGKPGRYDIIFNFMFDAGQITHMVSVNRDITKRLKNEEKLVKSLEALQKTMKEIVQAVSLSAELKDPFASGHQLRVSKLAVAIGKEMGLTDYQLESIDRASMVHDIGKISVPSGILSKPGKLTKGEFDLMKAHSVYGYELLSKIEFPWPIAKIVLQHTERINGSGYPYGLIGKDILLEARIISIAEVVEAMSSERPYRHALGIEKALSEIETNKGILYDKDAAAACIKLFREKGFKFS